MTGCHIFVIYATLSCFVVRDCPSSCSCNKYYLFGAILFMTVWIKANQSVCTRNAWNRCRKHQDEPGQNFAGIFDQFQRDPVCRQSQEDIGWTEALCKDMDEKAQQDHTCTFTKADKSNWSLAPDSSGKNGGPLASRPLFRAVVALQDHLYRESEDYLPPLPPQDQDRLPKRHKFSEIYREGSHVDQKTTRCNMWPSSSSSSIWCQSDKWDW